MARRLLINIITKPEMGMVNNSYQLPNLVEYGLTLTGISKLIGLIFTANKIKEVTIIIKEISQTITISLSLVINFQFFLKSLTSDLKFCLFIFFGAVSEI